MEPQQHEQPAEAAAAAGAAAVVLRVKRRRDYQAPQQIGKSDVMRFTGFPTGAQGFYMEAMPLTIWLLLLPNLLAVLEATSRAAALVSDFERSMGIAPASQQPLNEAAAAAAAVGPPRKRCRFVLLRADASALQQVR
jgi:hypothetical protein